MPLPKPSTNGQHNSESTFSILKDAEQVFVDGVFRKAKNSWFRYTPMLSLLMGERESVMLCYLINFAIRVGAKERERWFYCTEERVMDELMHQSRNKQTRSIRELKQLGFIRTKRKGSPPKRYIRIEYDQLIKAVDAEQKKWAEKQRRKELED